MLSLAYDGLIAYRRVAGAGGSTLVADLAASVPQPTDGGRTYTFQLRRGLRFSDGTPVRPEDFRASIERAVRLAGQVAPLYAGIVGADACSPRRCDLAKGIETDAAARTITIHLRRPDAEFEHKLAIPLAYVLPGAGAGDDHPRRAPRRERARTGSRRSHRHAARGWCATRAFARGRPRPVRTGSPTRSPSRPPRMPRRRWPPCSTAAPTQSSPPASSTVQLPLDQARALALTDASHVYTTSTPFTSYLFLNVRERPFDDPRVRRALNYAIDRRRMVELAGGSGLARPVLPGHPTRAARLRAHVSVHRGATPAGTWTAPDLARARRLVAASGSRGARVQVWGWPRYRRVIRYAGSVLRHLGYRVRIRVVPDVPHYFDYVNDTRHHVQVGVLRLVCRLPDPVELLRPVHLRLIWCATPAITSTPRSSATTRWRPATTPRWPPAARRPTRAGPNSTAGCWPQLQRSPCLPAAASMLVSDRVGNAQMHQVLGPLLDQFWVR